MRQYIGEGILEIPASWYNSSVNIFTAEEPGRAGPSITINRDRPRNGLTFSAYVSEQIARLKKQLQDFRIEEQSEIEICGHPAQIIEFTWQTQDGARMHQILCTVQCEAVIINLVASSGHLMNSDLRRQMLTILTSFRLMPQVSQPE